MSPRGDKNQNDSDDARDDINLAEILKNPEITKAINIAVSAWATNKPNETKLKFRALHLGVAFSALVLLMIGFLGYLNVLSKDVTGSLIGTLVGYWYGRFQGRKE